LLANLAREGKGLRGDAAAPQPARACTGPLQEIVMKVAEPDTVDTAAHPATAGSALTILCADHRRVQQLMGLYALLWADSGSQADRAGLIARIGACLHALGEVKQEIVYPLLASRADAELLERAQRGQASIEQSLSRVAAEDGGTVAMDMQMSELADLLHEQMAMEERLLFPLIEDIDSRDLASRVALRRSVALGLQGPD